MIDLKEVRAYCDRCGKVYIEEEEGDFIEMYTLKWASFEWEDLDYTSDLFKPIELCLKCQEEVDKFARTPKLKAKK